jgi:hypothetical protein
MSTEAIIQTLNSQVEQVFLGPQEEQITSALAANPTADTIAQITYDTIIAIDQQAASRGAPLDLDVLIPVATEAIDLLIEILLAIGRVKINEAEMREESLIKVALLHMRAVEGNPEKQMAAREMLAVLANDGDLERSMQHINEQSSATPDQMQAAGSAIAAPKQNPVAAGVSRGLMQP